MPGNFLVTGSRGGNTPHVSSSQARNFNAGIVGPGSYVMEGLDASMTTANTLHVSSGVASFQGADVEVPSGGCDLTIQNGSQGMLRNDLVVFRYEVEGKVESVSLEVIQGTPASSDPQDPEYNDSSIADGASPVDFPLYRVPLTGISVGAPVKLFDTIPTIDSLRDSVSQNLFVNPSPSSPNDHITLTVRAGIGYLSVDVHTSIQPGAFRQLATLPDGIRPQVSTYANMANFPNAQLRAFVSADTGAISFYCTAAQDGVSGSMSFPLA